MNKEKIINLETGEETWRDYTEAEIAEVEAAAKEAANAAKAQLAKEAAKAALLEKLGISEDEARLLLG